MNKEKKLFDISSLDTRLACNKGTEVEIIDPYTDQGSGLFFKILGKDSDVCRNFLKKTEESKRIKEAMARRRGRDVEVSTLEQNEHETISLIAACTIGWRMNDSETIICGGEEMTFSNENMMKVLENLTIRTTLGDSIFDIKLFTKR